MLGTRFVKTFEYVTQGVRHDPAEMITIPNHPQIIAERVFNLRTSLGSPPK
jgi:hypothetical protein